MTQGRPTLGHVHRRTDFLGMFVDRQSLRITVSTQNSANEKHMSRTHHVRESDASVPTTATKSRTLDKARLGTSKYGPSEKSNSGLPTLVETTDSGKNSVVI